MAARAFSRVSATPVMMYTIADSSLGSRIAWRMLTIGSSTAPWLPVSGPGCSRAAGRSRERVRPTNSCRLVSKLASLLFAACTCSR